MFSFLNSKAHCAGAAPGVSAGSDVHDMSYYGKCMIGGIFACGLTHTAVVPLDIVKCKMQANPSQFPGMKSSYRHMVATQGYSWITLGWAPTLIGYSMQGFAKFGFYEVFKDVYGGIAASMMGEERARNAKPIVWAIASASAEFIADVMLCPMEAVKVRMQTKPQGTFPTTLGPAFNEIKTNEGTNGLFKGIGPLWARQIPYTIMKFVVFEATVSYIFQNVLKAERKDFGKSFNLLITFISGYFAGIVCAIVSHPADTLFTAYNKQETKGAFMPEAKRLYSEMPSMGLWKGLGARIIMVGTLTGLQWWIYDSWKTICGLQATGSK